MDIQVIGGRYVIEKLLGEGGMGKVWLCTDRLSQKKVALKVIKEALLSDETIQSLKREFETATRLHHPNLIEVSDFGFDHKYAVYFITMEYVQGETLAKALKKGDIFNRQKGIIILLDLLRVLSFIESRGIIHRDINPQNIIVQNNRVVLMDFGLAMLLGEKHHAQGTIAYMAPEELYGKSSPSSDLYSVGVTIFEIVTGVRFFNMDNARKAINLLKNEKLFTQFQQERLDVLTDIDLRNILEELTHYRPDNRPISPAATISLVNNTGNTNYPIESAKTKDAYVLGAQFIGRTVELQKLREHIKKDAHDTLFWVRGKAGVGKSRLMAEFKRQEQLNNTLYYEGNCYENQYLMYQPFVRIVNELLYSCDDKFIKQYGPYLKKIVPSHSQLASIESRDAGDSQTERSWQINSIARLIFHHGLQSTRKIILYCNDIQWADEGTIEVIEKLLSLLSKADHNRVRVFVSSRHEGEGIEYLQNSSFTKIDTLDVSPFNEHDVLQYIEGAFGKKYISENLREATATLNRKVGGNPFFLQEFIKTLLSSDVIQRTEKQWGLRESIESIKVPENIGDLFTKRLKRLALTPQEKIVLETLSLLNRRISFSELKNIISVSQETLSTLENLELISSEKYHDEMRYRPAHDIIRETVNSVMGELERIELHRLLAEKLEYIHRDELQGYVESLAYHYTHGHNRRKAIEYLEKAGKKAQKVYENRKALVFYDQLLHLLHSDNAKKKIEILFEKGMITDIMGMWEESVSLYADIISLAIENNELDLQGKGHLFLGRRLRALGKKEAEDHFIRAIEIHEDNGNKVALADTYNQLGTYYSEVNRDFRAAEINHTKGLKISEECGFTVGMAMNIGNLSTVNYAMGDFKKAVENNHKAMNLARKFLPNYKKPVTYGLGQNSLYYEGMKNYEKALEYAEKMLEMATDIGSIPEQTSALAKKGRSLLYLDRVKEAREYCNRALQVLPQVKGPEHQYEVIIVHSKILCAEGKKGEAIREIEKLLISIEKSATSFDIAGLYFELWRIDDAPEYRSKALNLYKNIRETNPHFLVKDRLQMLEENGFSIKEGYLQHDLQEDEEEDFSENFKGQYDSLRYSEGKIKQDLKRLLREEMNRVMNTSVDEFLEKSFTRLNKTVYSFHKHSSGKSALVDNLKHNDDFIGLMSTIGELNSNLDLNDLLTKILDESIKLMQAERGAVFLVDEDGYLKIKSARSHDNKDLIYLNVSNTVIQKTREAEQTLFFPDLIQDEELSMTQSIMDMDIRSVMCAPLKNNRYEDPSSEGTILHKKIIGFIYLDSRDIADESDFTESNMKLFQILADQAAIAIYNSILTEHLRGTLSEKVTAEQEILQLNASLEDKVEERTRELKKAYREISENAYKAGMAEIASQVLHNVGNVLNSVMVSSRTMDSTIQNSRIQKLQKANNLLKENLDDIEGFLRNDPRGKKLLEFYLMIGEGLESENKTLSYHAGRLENKTQIIRDIIESQQEYASAVEMDAFYATPVIEDALKILEISLQESKVTVERNYSSDMYISGKKFKVIHIFINVIKNAIEAMGDTETNGRILRIDGYDEQNTIIISFTDTGCGINKDDLKKMFTHGFTTKKSGHGFGLHACANYMTEMGGKISLSSKGLGLGTTLSLRFERSTMTVDETLEYQ